MAEKKKSGPCGVSRDNEICIPNKGPKKLSGPCGVSRDNEICIPNKGPKKSSGRCGVSRDFHEPDIFERLGGWITREAVPFVGAGVTGFLVGGPVLGVCSALTTTNETTVYTVPAETTAIVKSIRVSNDDASNACTLTMTLTDSSSNAFSLEKDKSIAAKTSAELLTSTLVAKESEVFKATAQNANDLHIIISVLQITNT